MVKANPRQFSAEPGRVTRVVGHAYPWDVIGDPGFGGRVLALGVREVALAASYHSARAATPLHPLHRVVDAPEAALYRPVRDEVWSGRSLRPAEASWVPSAGIADGDTDTFARAALELHNQGLRVDAWLVLAHSTRLGTLRPDLAVRNCFGDSYAYALCVAHPEVRDYVATLATEAVRDVPISGVSVEGLGQMGFAHNGPHEKTDGAYGPAAQRILSVCCCRTCQDAWGEKGLDPRLVIVGLREALDEAQNGDHPDASVQDLLGDNANHVLATRLRHQDLARRQVIAALREVAPQARLTLHGQADPWATGPSPAFTAEAAGECDSILVPAWGINNTTYTAVADARALAPDNVSIGAYVTVLPPAGLAALPAHTDGLVDAGADELHLYHLGLATTERLDALGAIARNALA